MSPLKLPEPVPTLHSDWFRIVRNYSDLVQLTLGPTLPFIVGAIRDPVGEAPDTRAAGQRELYSLLKKMNDAPVGVGVKIQFCPGIGAHVVAAAGNSSLTWDPSELAAGGVDDLFGQLWDCYGDQISAGEYSKDGDWHRFTSTEFKNIRKAIGIV